MGILSKVTGIRYAQRAAAPGKSVLIRTATAIEERELEMYHPPGISSAPTENDQIVEIPIGTKRIIVAAHNYRVEIEPEAGETIIYSTDSAGAAEAAKIHLKNDGTIEINGNDKTLVTHTELNTALQTLVTALNTALGTKLDGGGTPGALTLDISAAATTTVKTGG
jgi:phage gp45-like